MMIIPLGNLSQKSFNRLLGNEEVRIIIFEISDLRILTNEK